MMKKGFTLIELLAVIVILSVIAIIAVPLIGDTINYVRRASFLIGAQNIANAGEQKCSEKSITDDSTTLRKYTIKIENGVETSDDKLDDYYKGKAADSGDIVINEKCKVALALWNNSLRTCAYKGFDSDKPMLIDLKNAGECTLKNDGSINSDYVDTSSTGYKCSNPGSVVATEEKYFTFDQSTGKITSYSSEGPKDVIIPCKIAGKYVTEIGRSAFSGMGLTSVVMPDTIKTIDSFAFVNNNISKLDLGSGVESISYSGFANNKLTEVVLPDSLKITYGSYDGGMCGSRECGAFVGNPITKVTFGSGIETIGERMFEGDQISELDLSRSTKLKVVGGGAFAGNKLTSLVLPDSVESIQTAYYSYAYSTWYDGAFENNKLTSVKMGNNVKSIGKNGFRDNLIEDLTLSKNLTSIGDDAFKNNQLPDDQAFIMGRNADTTENNILTSYGGANRSNITIPDNVATTQASFSGLGITGTFNTGNGLTNIPNSMLGWNSLTTVIVGNNVTSIGSSAFQNNKISSLTLGNKLETIYYSAFKGNNLTEVVLPDSLKTTYGSYDEGIFMGNQITKATFGSNIEVIGERMFQGNNLTELDLSRSTKLKTIGGGAFVSNNLTSLVLPDSVESICTASYTYLYSTSYAGAFANNKLTSVKMGNNVKRIDEYAFINNQIEELNLSSGLTNIGVDAFKNNQLPDNQAFIMGRNTDGTENTVLTSYGGANRSNITIPDKVKTVTATFSGLGITGTFNTGNGLTNISDNMLSSNTITNLVIGDSITSIGRSALWGNKLTALKVGNNVTTIDSGAFANNLIATITFGNKLESIGSSAFSSNKLTEVTLPDSLKTTSGSWGDGIFSGNQITKATFGSGIETIGTQMFIGNQLTELDLSRSTKLKTIGGGAFYGNKLTSLVLPDSVESICTDSNTYMYSTSYTGAFANNKLTSVKMGNNVKRIDGYAFTNNQIEDLTLSSGITSIGEDAFKNNQLPDNQAFIMGRNSDGTENNVLTSYGGANRSNITIPDKVKSSTATFSGLGITGTFNTGIGLTSIPNYMLNGNTITNLVIGNVVTSIGYQAFASNKITDLEIPSSVTSISSEAFNGNPLNKIFIKGKVNSTNFTSLGSYWNGSCTNIIYELASCYTYVGSTITDYASVCSKNVEIPSTLGGNTITTIGDNAFNNKGLTRVVLPSSITTIGSEAFSNNSIDPIIVMGKASQTNFASTGSNWNGGYHVLYENNPDTCFKISGTDLTGIYDENICSRDITIPSGVITIKDSSLAGHKITSAIISNTVKVIESNAFANNLLNGITVKDGTRLTSTGTGWNGTAYKVNFEGDSYEYNCFTLSGNQITGYKQYCSATVDLSKTIQGNTITSVGANAFKNSAITNLNISSNITSIGDSAFEGNDIEAINIAEGVTSIGARAFYDSNLVTISIPASVKTIGDNAFASNSLLKTIYVTGKSSSSGFTSLGTGWNGTCTNIVYGG